MVERKLVGGTEAGCYSKWRRGLCGSKLSVAGEGIINKAEK